MDKKLLAEDVQNIYKKLVTGEEIDKEELKKTIERFNELLNAPLP